MSIAVVVPAYNDPLNLEALCRDFLDIAIEGVELIIVDNGSENSNALDHLKILNPGLIRIVRLAENAGFGGGDTGWAQGSANRLGGLDAGKHEGQTVKFSELYDST